MHTSGEGCGAGCRGAGGGSAHAPGNYQQLYCQPGQSSSSLRSFKSVNDRLEIKFLKYSSFQWVLLDCALARALIFTNKNSRPMARLLHYKLLLKNRAENLQI